MSEISFLRDQDRTRLVIPVGETDGYSLRMMEKRSFTGLMPVEILSLNGESYCCYDVSGAVSLENRCKAFRPGGDDIDSLFEGYAAVCSELEDYLMDASGILMEPGYVFYDMGRECYRFVLDPSGGGGGSGELLTFLTDRVDPKDDAAVSFVYGLCEMSMADEHFSLLPAVESMNRRRISGEGVTFSDAVPVNNKDSLFGLGFDIPDYDEEPETGIEQNSEKAISRIYLISAVVGILGLVGAAFLYLTFEMEMDELCVTAACAAVMFAVTLYSLKMISEEKKAVSRRNKKGSEKSKHIQENKDELPDTALDTGGDEVSPEKTMEDQTDQTETENAETGTEDEDEIQSSSRLKELLMRQQAPEPSQPSPERDYYKDYAMEERTVLFTDNKPPEEYTLYSLDGTSPPISLDKLPAIAGKIQGLSDIVLSDASVSRLHARFDKEDGMVTVTDLDSTNGTFVNGRRLKANETSFLRSGDELRLGILDFCMR